MHRRPRAAITTCLAVVAAVSSACGSSGSPATSSGSQTSASTGSSASSSTAVSGSSAAAPTSAAGASGTATADTATTAAITKAYATFFSTTADVPASEAALQHGQKFAATLQAEASSAYANKASVTITSVTLASPDVANVKFTLKTAGLTLPIDGKAARENGAWKVAAVTFCGLLQAEGHAPPICSDPSVVGLPG